MVTGSSGYQPLDINPLAGKKAKIDVAFGAFVAFPSRMAYYRTMISKGIAKVTIQELPDSASWPKTALPGITMSSSIWEK